MKKVMVLLGVTLVSGLILTTAQDIQAQETSGNTFLYEADVVALGLQTGVAEADPNQALALARDIILMVIQEKGISLIVGPVRATSQVVIMTVTMNLVKLIVLAARIVRVWIATLTLNQVAVRVIQTVSLLLVTVLASQNRIQIQDTQSHRCHLLS